MEMNQKLKAIYQNGTFVPQASCGLPNNTEVELTIHQSHILASDIIDPKARKEILNSLLQRMKQAKSH